MAIQLGSAYGKVSIDSSGVTNGVNSALGSLNKLSSVATALGGTMQNVGNAMTLGLTLPIIAMGGASIKAASSLNESMNKVNVVFGESSKEILKWSENSATAFGQSQRQALEAAGTFGNLFTSMGMARGEASEMSMSLVELASDLASFNDISPDEALIKLRAGLVGETEPLRTLGVNLTAAAVQAKAMEMGLAGANGELSQAALVQARYALILEQTANAQGDFARTADSFANVARSSAAEFENLRAELGENILPMAVRVLQGLNKLLEFFNNLPEPVQNAIIVLAGLVAVLGPVISFLGTIVSFIGGIASLGTTLSGLGISMGALSTAAGAAGTALAGVGMTALTVVAPLLLIVATIYLVYLAFKNNFMGITTAAQQLWFIIKYYFSEGWKWLINAVQQGGTIVANWFKNMTTKIVAYFKGIKWSEIGKFIVFGIVNGLTGGAPLLLAAAVRLARAALDAIKKTLGIKSPSTEFMKVGAFSGKGFQMGLEKMMDPATIAKTMAKPVNSFVTSSQASYSMQFSNGLTLRDVDRLMEQKLTGFTRKLDRALGGA